jgi:aerotaxis receptor
MGREIKMTSQDLIVSETDERGVITYANDTFCRFAGYELDELIGQPHNLIRHEDMPKWAFEWLWNSLKAGQTWAGFVKNKSRSGDFYWVYATAYPTVLPSGEVRYTSIRVAPDQAEVDAYAGVYAAHHSKAPEILKALGLRN